MFLGVEMAAVRTGGGGQGQMARIVGMPDGRERDVYGCFGRVAFILVTGNDNGGR